MIRRLIRKIKAAGAPRRQKVADQPVGCGAWIEINGHRGDYSAQVHGDDLEAYEVAYEMIRNHLVQSELELNARDAESRLH